jgi:hypothetical protein
MAAGRVHGFFIRVPEMLQARSVGSGGHVHGTAVVAARQAVPSRGPLMRRLSTEYPFTCVTCEVEIAGNAVFHVGLPFCCSGCVAGGPCTCSYDLEVIDHERAVDPAALTQQALADDRRGLADARR